MLMPTVWGRNLFDDFFAYPWKNDFEETERKLYGKHAGNLMKTDIREKDGNYEVCIDIPGFNKEDLELHLENGYVVVKAEKKLDNDKKDKDGKILRKERYSGSMERSFYVGEQITEEDIKAKYENGVLTLDIPKKEAEVPERKTIAIEG